MPIPAQRDEERSRTALAAWWGAQVEADGEVELSALVRPDSSGFSNETLLCEAAWTAGGHAHRGAYVVRVAPTGYALFPDADFSLQHRVVRALAGTAVPVPVVPWVEDDSSVLGAPFYVMERAAGRVPADRPPYHVAGWLVDDATPAQRERVWLGAFDVLADLHALVPTALDLAPLPRGTQEVVASYERLLEQVERSEQAPVARRALAWLHDHELVGGPDALSWGDARLGNLVYDDAGNVRCVLDWEMAALLPPEADVAWALFMDRHHSEGMDVPRLEGFASEADSVARYEARAGRRLAPLAPWTVFAGFRSSVILAALAVLFKDWGLLPADAPMAQDNTASRTTSRVLDELGA